MAQRWHKVPGSPPATTAHAVPPGREDRWGLRQALLCSMVQPRATFDSLSRRKAGEVTAALWEREHPSGVLRALGVGTQDLALPPCAFGNAKAELCLGRKACPWC